MTNMPDTEYQSIVRITAPAPLLLRHCQRICAAFTQFIAAGAPDDTILDVGISESMVPDHRLSAMLRPEQLAYVTCCDIPLSVQGNATAGIHMEKPLDNRKLPFPDYAFDWVFCNGVIEYAGTFQRQYELMKELARVARRGVFLTTANRWHPLEFNTSLPLLHWLPPRIWRRLLKLAGKGAWASSATLNLLDVNGLKKLVSLLPGGPKSDIGHIRYFGLKGHFFLLIEKPPLPGKAASREAA